jgi:hypothetical protein
MTARDYLELVHRLTGLSGMESFWMHSAILSAEVFCVVALMVWVFPHSASIKPPAARTAITYALLAIYCLVVMTSMLLFMAHQQVSANPSSPSEYGYFGAALAFFLVGWSPMIYLVWRKQRLNPNGD